MAFTKKQNENKGESALEQQNNQKITDKAFTRFVATSVFGILVCIACLCSSTFAWFNVSQDSSHNIISAGSFDHTVEVQITDTENGAAVIAPAADGNGMTYKLQPGKSYTVKLTPTSDTTVKGYCVVTVDGTAYNTDTYGAVAEGALDELTFTLTIPEDDGTATVTFKPHWGIAAIKHVRNGEVLTCIVASN